MNHAERGLFILDNIDRCCWIGIKEEMKDAVCVLAKRAETTGGGDFCEDTDCTSVSLWEAEDRWAVITEWEDYTGHG